MKSAQQAFTLVEILISILIIGVFVALPVFAYSNYTRKQRDLQRKNDLNQVQSALMQYKASVGKYPDTNQLETLLIESGFITELPEDPYEGKTDDSGVTYGYEYTSDGINYQLSALLEDDSKLTFSNETRWYVITPVGASEQKITPGPGFLGFPTSTPSSLSSGLILSQFPTITLRPTATATPVFSPTPTSPAPADTGIGIDMVLKPDGFPLISYYDVTNNVIQTVACSTSSCTPGNRIITSHSSAYAASYLPDYRFRTAIVIPPGDSLPYIAHIYGNSTPLVRGTKCSDVNCTASQKDIALYSGSSGAYFVSALINGDATPFISFKIGSNGIYFKKCINSTCTISTNSQLSSPNPVETIDTILASDGFPLIANTDMIPTGSQLDLQKCYTLTCGGGALGRDIISASAETGLYPSVALAAGSIPVIASYNKTAGNLTFTRCGTPDCSDTGITTDIDTSGDVGAWASIAIGADGFPVIAYMELLSGTHSSPTASNLKVRKCNNAACTASSVTTIESGTVGMYTKIAVPSDGNPFIAYYDYSGKTLKTHKCTSANCQ